MYEKFLKLEELVVKKSKILLVAHRKPDLDTISSVLAFYNYLKSFGKVDVDMFCSDKPNRIFSFVEDVDLFVHKVDLNDYDLIITLDLAAISMLGNASFDFEDRNYVLVNVDHHVSNTLFGDLNIVDTESASTTMLLYRYFKAVEFSISNGIATHLLNGLYTDTGAFMHDNSSDLVFDVAGDLWNCGARITSVVRKMFLEKSVFRMRALALVLDRLQVYNDIAFSVFSHLDLKVLGLKNEHFAGCIEYLNMLPGVKFSVLLNKMSSGKLKGSFRTRNDAVDVAKIAEILGGGGHRKAAGFLIDADFDNERFRIVFNDLSKKYFQF